MDEKAATEPVRARNVVTTFIFVTLEIIPRHGYNGKSVNVKSILPSSISKSDGFRSVGG
jgi:hypothetical protein